MPAKPLSDLVANAVSCLAGGAIALVFVAFYRRESAHAVDAEPTSAPAAIASAPIVAASAGHGPAAPVKKPTQRVVLITVDALRADQPWLGYSAFETPRLTAFAKESRLYTHAYSLSNTTTPSLSSLLSARYAIELERDDCPLEGLKLDHGLPATLAAAGIHTVGVHGHAIFASNFAPKEGFETWRLIDAAGSRRSGDGAITGDEIARLAIEELGKASPDERLFLWAHFVDPHDAYVAHPETPMPKVSARSLYDGEVAFTDIQIGKVLDAIAASPAADRTVVFFAADHGEGFGEHQSFRHGYTMYDEELRVPLMIHGAGFEPARIDVPRSTIDVARTIAALFDVAPPDPWRGHSLLDDARGAEERPVMIAAPQLLSMPMRRAYVRGTKKWMADGDGYNGKVFDLAADPGEKTPIVGPDAMALRDEARRAFEAIPMKTATTCTREAFRPGTAPP